MGINEKKRVVNGNLIQTLTESIIDSINDFFNIFRIFQFHMKSPQNYSQANCIFSGAKY